MSVKEPKTAKEGYTRLGLEGIDYAHKLRIQSLRKSFPLMGGDSLLISI